MKEHIKVLFICHGNICRSPMAEFIFKDILHKENLTDRFFVASAATSTEEIYRGVGNPVYPPAREELMRHNISCEGKRAIRVEKRDAEEYDYLICMDHFNVRNLKRIIGEAYNDKISLLLDYTTRTNKEISDPWYSGNFTQTYEDIVEGCYGLLRALRDKEKYNE